MIIPSALSQRELITLQRYAKDISVLEIGSLLGRSTVALAHVAKRVISIDHHMGYPNQLNDTLRLFLSNLETYTNGNVIPMVANFRDLTVPRTDLAFIDLTGTYADTLTAIEACPTNLIAVHDFERNNCEGVKQAITPYTVIERIDSLIIIRKEMI